MQSQPTSTPYEWRARSSRGGSIGIAITVVAGLCAIAALIYIFGRPIAIDSFAGTVACLASLLLAIFVGELTRGFFNMRYRLADGFLSIKWLFAEEKIPLGKVDGIYGGHRFGKKIEIDGVSWPGYGIGTTRVEGLGRLKYYGTSTAPDHGLIVATADVGYVITPDDKEGFRGRLIEMLEGLTEEDVERAPEPKLILPRFLNLSIWRDGTAMSTLAVAILVLVVSFGYVSFRFPSLPDLMPMHYNYAGDPDLIAPPADAFRIPLMGVLILLINGAIAAAVHAWQRDSGRIMAAATFIVEMVMLVAVVRVVH